MQSLLAVVAMTALLLGPTVVHGHSWMTCPPSFDFSDTRGGLTTGPCEATTPTVTTHVQAGDRLKVGWTSNNHGGGFVRLSLAPKSQISQATFDQNVLKTSCYGHDERPGYYAYGDCVHPCNARGGCEYQADIHDRERYDTTVTIPTNLADGEYVLQWRALVGNGGGYFSCASITVTGGNPSLVCPRPNEVPQYDCVRSNGPPLSDILPAEALAGEFCYHTDQVGAVDDRIRDIPVNVDCDPRTSCQLSVNQDRCLSEFPHNSMAPVDCSAAVLPPPPATCDDLIQNQGETDVDCGGPVCAACTNGGAEPIDSSGHLVTTAYSVSSTWVGGFSATAQLTLLAPVTGGWTLSIFFDAPIASFAPWGGTVTHTNTLNTIFTMSNPEWSTTHNTGDVLSVGFTVAYTGSLMPNPVTFSFVCLGCAHSTALPPPPPPAAVSSAAVPPPPAVSSAAAPPPPVASSAAAPPPPAQSSVAASPPPPPAAASSAAAVPPAPQPTGALSGNRIVMYYTAWSTYGRNFQVSDIDASGITHINYAFANVVNGRCILGDAYADTEKTFPGDTWDQPLRGNFNQLLKLKQQFPHVKVLLSLGGWTWSGGFPAAAATAQARTTFVDSCMAMMTDYSFDGIDVDWEYPNNPTESTDFSLLLALFRQRLGPAGLLTIAAPAGDARYALLDWPAINTHVSWANIMSYDFNGAWDNERTAHNAAVYPNPADPSTDVAKRERWNLDFSLRGIIGMGLEPSKCVMGVPFYGRGWSNVADTQGLSGLFGVPGSSSPPAGTWEPGVFDYSDLVHNYIGKNGFVRHWDSVSQAAYLYNPSTKVFISYDDVQSFQAKCVLARSLGLSGFMAWDLSSDLNNELLNELLKCEGLTASAIPPPPAAASSAAPAAAAATSAAAPPPPPPPATTSAAAPPPPPATGCDPACGTGVYAPAGSCVTVPLFGGASRCACVSGWSGPNAIFFQGALLADHCSTACVWTSELHSSECGVDMDACQPTSVAARSANMNTPDPYAGQNLSNGSGGGGGPASGWSTIGLIVGTAFAAIFVVALAVLALLVRRSRTASPTTAVRHAHFSDTLHLNSNHDASASVPEGSFTSIDL